MFKKYEEDEIYPYSDLGPEPVYGKKSKAFRQSQKVVKNIGLMTSEDIRKILDENIETKKEDKELGGR